jgi:hypothetical protein
MALSLFSKIFCRHAPHAQRCAQFSRLVVNVKTYNQNHSVVCLLGMEGTQHLFIFFSCACLSLLGNYQKVHKTGGVSAFYSLPASRSSRYTRMVRTKAIAPHCGFTGWSDRIPPTVFTLKSLIMDIFMFYLTCSNLFFNSINEW